MTPGSSRFKVPYLIGLAWLWPSKIHLSMLSRCGNIPGFCFSYWKLLVPEVCEILSMEVANMNSTEVEKVKESWSENEDLAEEIYRNIEQNKLIFKVRTSWRHDSTWFNCQWFQPVYNFLKLLLCTQVLARSGFTGKSWAAVFPLWPKPGVGSVWSIPQLELKRSPNIGELAAWNVTKASFC